MKRIILFLLASIVLMGTNIAQDSKIITGVIAFEQGEYDEAIKAMELGMTNADALKPKNLAKGQIYLTQAYMRVHELNKKDNPTKYPNALLKAAKNFAGFNMLDDKLKSKHKNINTLVQANLYNLLYNDAANTYNDKKYKASISRFKAASALSPDEYGPFMMLGYAHWNSQDTVSALPNWEKALKAYKASAAGREKEDPNIASTYVMLASSYTDAKNANKALTILEEAREKYPTNEDLQRTELRVYQQHPELFDQARVKFEQAIKDNPSDNVIKLAYGVLLSENGDEARSMELFNQVAKAEPDNYTANVRIGAQFINKAAKYSKELEAENDEDKIPTLEAKVLDNLKAAYPYMVKCHEAKPNNYEWVSQLVNISLYVPEFLGESKKWSTKLKELRAKGGR